MIATLQPQYETIRHIQREFHNIFGQTVSEDILENYFNRGLVFTIHFTPDMLCQLMDYYVLSKEEMARCMGVSFDCLDVLLGLRFELPRLFNTRIGYAMLVLALGVRKYGRRRFLKWYKYYLKKHVIEPPMEPHIFVEIIKLLSLPDQLSISYYWKELRPRRTIELPSCFNSKDEYS